MIGRERSYLLPHPFATHSILRPLLPYKKTVGVIIVYDVKRWVVALSGPCLKRWGSETEKS